MNGALKDKRAVRIKHDKAEYPKARPIDLSSHA
jgi:hypothetical protein